MASSACNGQQGKLEKLQFQFSQPQLLKTSTLVRRTCASVESGKMESSEGTLVFDQGDSHPRVSWSLGVLPKQ